MKVRPTQQASYRKVLLIYLGAGGAGAAVRDGRGLLAHGARAARGRHRHAGAQLRGRRRRRTHRALRAVLPHQARAPGGVQQLHRAPAEPGAPPARLACMHARGCRAGHARRARAAPAAACLHVHVIMVFHLYLLEAPLTEDALGLALRLRRRCWGRTCASAGSSWSRWSTATSMTSRTTST